jgi:hypothetical protein
MTAIGMALAPVAACGAASPPGNAADKPAAQNGGRKPSPRVARDKALDAAPKSGPGEDNPERCPHGALEDPHRGFVRCLRPEEKNAAWLPPAPQREPAPEPPGPNAGANPAQAADAGTPPVGTPPVVDAPAPEPAAAVPSVPPLIEVKEPSFTNGDVPRTVKFLSGLSKEIGRCVADNGGLSGATGSMKVQFLVRVRGRAEGVEVLRTENVRPEAASCVRLLLKNRAVGAPTADPVGVTVTLAFTKAPK